MCHAVSCLAASFEASEAGGADVAGVSTERGELDVNFVAERLEQSRADFVTNALQEVVTQRARRSAEVHSSAEHDGVRVDSGPCP